ncbi:WD40 repeat-like protein [Ramaria rubella]|nr:WD40 repeat-like protein [Ramaria rubella]
MWVGASPDEKLIAASSWDTTVKIWDITQMKRSIMRGVTFPGTLPGFDSSAFSPDGNIVFYHPNRNTVVGLSASNRTEVFRLEGHTGAIMWVGASPDVKLIATSSWDSTVKIWDISDGSLIKTLKGIKGQSWTGCWSPDSRFIAVGGGDRTVRVWDVRSGETVHVFGEDEKLFSGWVRGLAFETAEGKYLTTAADGGMVRVFDMDSGNSIGFSGGGMFEFAKGGRRIYSGDTDGAVRMWDLD